MSKYIQTAREQYITLKRFDHHLCTAIPTGRGKDGKIEVRLIKCPHLKENRTLLITREDI